MGTTLEISLQFLALDSVVLDHPIPDEDPDQKQVQKHVQEQVQEHVQKHHQNHEKDGNPAPDQQSEQVHQQISRAFQLAHEYESLLSKFNSGSVISKLNRTRDVVHIDERIAPVFYAGLELEIRFPRVFQLAPACHHGPSALEVVPRGIEASENGVSGAAPLWLRRVCDCELDLGGIAKGFVVDRVFESLSYELGAGCELLVNAGGDLRLTGERQIEIRVPVVSQPEVRYGVLLNNAAIATSTLLGGQLSIGELAGRYQVDFRRQSAPSTVSVVADTCLYADAFTKIGFRRDLARELSPQMADEFGLRAVLSFDEQGVLVERSAR